MNLGVKSAGNPDLRRCMQTLRKNCRSADDWEENRSCTACLDTVKRELPNSSPCNPLGTGTAKGIAKLCSGDLGRYVPLPYKSVQQCEQAAGLRLVDSRDPSEKLRAVSMDCQALAVMRASEYALQGTCDDDTCSTGICATDNTGNYSYCITPLSEPVPYTEIAGFVPFALAALGKTKYDMDQVSAQRYESEGPMNAHASAEEFLTNFANRSYIENQYELYKLGPEARAIVDSIGRPGRLAYAVDSELKADHAADFLRQFHENTPRYRDARVANPQRSHAHEFNNLYNAGRAGAQGGRGHPRHFGAE